MDIKSKGRSGNVGVKELDQFESLLLCEEVVVCVQPEIKNKQIKPFKIL